MGASEAFRQFPIAVDFPWRGQNQVLALRDDQVGREQVGSVAAGGTEAILMLTFARLDITMADAQP